MHINNILTISVAKICPLQSPLPIVGFLHVLNLTWFSCLCIEACPLSIFQALWPIALRTHLLVFHCKQEGVQSIKDSLKPFSYCELKTAPFLLTNPTP